MKHTRFRLVHNHKEIFSMIIFLSILKETKIQFTLRVYINSISNSKYWSYFQMKDCSFTEKTPLVSLISLCSFTDSPQFQQNFVSIGNTQCKYLLVTAMYTNTLLTAMRISRRATFLTYFSSLWVSCSRTLFLFKHAAHVLFFSLLLFFYVR